MKLKLLLIAVCFGFNVRGMAQVKFGVELNAYSSKLTNISPDTFVRAGLSGATVTPARAFRIAPSVLLRKEISKRLILETGVGYIANKHNMRLQFDYGNDSWSRPPIDTTLNIILKYIQIPISVLYSFPLHENANSLEKHNLKLNLSGGIKTRYLLFDKDNYQDLLFEEIWLWDGRYKKIVIIPTFGIALENKLPKGQVYEVGFFGAYNLNSLVNKDRLWGFFHNLYPATNLELGLSLKFFF